jgi:diadenosine tetraphosphate (Ap4A) HIT family hydrolase
MASVFTKIIRGEIPGRFVWKDDRVVAFLTIQPIHAGHVLVVPRHECDHWIDLEPSLWAHVGEVAQTIGRALQHGFAPKRVGIVVAGFEVPHVHLHVIPTDSMADLEFARARAAKPEELDAAAAKIRASLDALGLPHGSA